MTDNHFVSKQFLEGIKNRYPEFDNIDHPGFVEEEITYKQKIFEEASKRLSKNLLQQFLDTEDYQSFYDAVLAIGSHPQNNLLYRSNPSAGDLHVLHADAVKNDLKSFCNRMFDLLYGTDPVSTRIDQFVSWLKSLGVRPKWTFVTYYLFVVYPQDEFFIKPSIIQQFLKWLGEEKQWSAEPSGELYEYIKEQVRLTGEALPFEIKRDFLDLQSLLYVAAKSSQGQHDGEEGDFSWLPFHQAFIRILPDYEDRQPELIEILKQAGVTGFQDKDQDGNTIELREIDPFTFFFYIYKYGPTKQVEILRKIAKKYDLDAPTGTSGIPSANALKVWLYPYQRDRNHDEIGRLWNFFHKALSGELTDELFQDILKIKSTGKTKITEALYYVNPEEFLPVNGQTRPYLNEVLKIDPKFKTWEEYLDILEKVREKDERQFYTISHDAWVWNTKRKSEENGQPGEGSDSRKFWLYSPGPHAEHFGTFFDERIMGIGWDDLGDLKQYPSKKAIRDQLNQIDNTNSSKSNDATACYEFRNKMSKGDVVIAKKGRSKLIGCGVVSSDYVFDESRKHFKHIRPVDWKLKGDWGSDDNQLVTKTLTDITKYETDHDDYDLYFERLLGEMGVDLDEILMMDTSENKTLVPEMNLNTILYGPPGTGKTYTLRADYFSRFTQSEKRKSIEEFETEKITGLSWWETIALVLLKEGSLSVPEIRQHRFIDLKTNVAANQNVNQAIWAQLQIHTHPEDDNVKYASRSEPYIFRKGEKSVWSVLPDECQEKAPHLVELVAELNTYQPVETGKRNYVFTTFHQSFSYEDFVEGIKPFVGDDSTAMDGEQADIGYVIEKGIFYHAVDEACRLAGFLGLKDCLNRSDEERKAGFETAPPYAIFIDEINRGNISAILGELITLIEPDKRLTAGEELIVRLPYSKSPFSVPPNLYIIGTLNTADRSVEALDTALRRRFRFEEMPPDPGLLASTGVLQDQNGILQVGDSPVSLPDLLATINRRLVKIMDHDHTIGHSYFMEVSDWKGLRDVFRFQLIPLLEEFFYGDKGKIQLVLGKGFVEQVDGGESNGFFPATDYEDEGLFDAKVVWRIKRDWEKDEAAFADALGELDIQPNFDIQPGGS